MRKIQLLPLTGIALLALLVNTAYVAAFASPTIFYMTNALAHLGLGVAVALAAAWLLWKRPELRGGFVPAGILLGLATVLGVVLAVVGNVRDHRWILWAHIATAGLGLLALVPWVWRRAAEHVGGWLRFRNVFAGALVLLLALPAGTAVWRKANPNPDDRIVNPTVVPVSMEEEGGGPTSPFFPSSAKTNVGGIIPSNFFMDSETCGRCHKDLFKQWDASAHHFGSFNNQFYRKSIEYMQDVVGPQPSKWCAGCHDHAVFFNGRFERPIKEQIDTPEAHAGLACTSCHAIVKVDSTMGNGGFTIEYPPLHELATSKNPVIQKLDTFLTYLDPEPHRKTFMKPFMRLDSAEFCSACHKVHLDVPVNDYRWFRGFNDYDNWQASGISGQGARSFYYPKEPMNCVTCHMPLVESKDPGNKDGFVRSHRFPGANTALPTVNKDPEQLKVTQDFLTSGFLSVDIFAVAPVEESAGEPKMIRRQADAGPQLMSTFGVGEEAEQGGEIVIREVGKVAAPIDVAGATVAPGSTVRVDVVVRTRRIGHFFPGGTVDAFDVWLELKAVDAAGRVLFWSGKVEENPDGTKGPVEPGAHFYRSLQLDGEGNPIDKRNAWQTRSVLYTRLIPPGAADVAHYRLHVPEDAQGPIQLEAKVNHRKFAHSYTQFAYAGKPKAGQEKLITKSANSAEWTFDPKDIPENVSGKIKDRIPDLPITVVAKATTQLKVGTPQWQPVLRKEDRERWNDWGIGLFQQGDLKGAEYAFLKVTQAEPGYADGWVNVARALIREGETERARPYLARALKLDPQLGAANFFQAMVEKAAGDYDAALAALGKVTARYPRDRVVLNQIGRLHFLKRDYEKSVAALVKVLSVDPEDLQAHYGLMLSYRSLGETEKAEREAKLFRRFKAEEAAQAITAKRRSTSPEDNNERQQIHEHESVPLDWNKRPAGKAPAAPTAVSAAPVAASAGGMP